MTGTAAAAQLLSTIMRGAMFMDMSSWNSSLQAYGIRTWEIYRRRRNVIRSCVRAFIQNTLLKVNNVTMRTNHENDSAIIITSEVDTTAQ